MHERWLKFTWRRVIVTIAELRRSCTYRASRARRCLSRNNSFSTKGMSVSYLYIELIDNNITIEQRIARYYQKIPPRTKVMSFIVYFMKIIFDLHIYIILIFKMTQNNQENYRCKICEGLCNDQNSHSDEWYKKNQTKETEKRAQELCEINAW